MSVHELAQPPLALRLKRGLLRLLGERAVFFEGFLDHPNMVGAVVPSSRFTVAAMLARVDWGRAQVFVEYGPGVGTFTRAVLERLPRDGRLIAIDLNPRYVDYLNATISDGRFTAVLGSAAEVEAVLAAHGESGADYVLSGLPFLTLPPGVGDAIAAATQRALRPGGAFLVYQFAKAAHVAMAPHFRRIDSAFQWLNLPPYRLWWAWKD